jgi:hypothetical protein
MAHQGKMILFFQGLPQILLGRPALAGRKAGQAEAQDHAKQRHWDRQPSIHDHLLRTCLIETFLGLVDEMRYRSLTANIEYFH